MSPFSKQDWLNYSLEDLAFRYSFVRLLALLLVCLCSLSLILYAAIGGVFEITLLNTDWLLYLWKYWLQKWYYLLVIVLGGFLIFSAKIRNLYLRHIQYSNCPKLTDAFIDYKIKRHVLVLILGSILLVIIAVPFAHLAYSNSEVLLSILLVELLLILGAYAFFIHRKTSKQTKALAGLNFADHSFNTASIGGQPKESMKELRFYRKIRKGGARNDKVQKYITSGFGNSRFKGYKQLFNLLAQFLDPKSELKSLQKRISIHQNTTDAIRYCLSILNEPQTQFIYLDSCYPSVNKHVIHGQTLHRHSQSHWIEVLQDLKKGKIDKTEINQRIIERINEIRVDKPNSRIVLAISHVVYKTGTVYPLEALLDQITSLEDKQLFVVIDGAQAIGNINISTALLSKCDYYCGCAHKWLMGKETLGFLVHNHSYLKVKGISAKESMNTNLAFSTHNYDGNYTETTNLESYFSLSVTLEDLTRVGIEKIADHNIRLARHFADLITQLTDIRVLTHPINSGIVVLKLKKSQRVLLSQILKSEYKLNFESYESEGFIRFSFHYYMGMKHVHFLVSCILAAEAKRKNIKHKNT